MFHIQISKDLELRLLEEKDAKALFALTDQNRTHLRKWLPWLDKTQTVKDSKSFIKSGLEQYAKKNGFHAGIFYQGKLAGAIGLHFINWEHKFTSVGYWVGEEFEGQGLVTQACKALIDYIFDTLKLNRVEIRCATTNMRSRAIPERLGFQTEGVIRQREWLYDHFVDHVVYGLLSSQWKRQKATKGKIA